MLVAVSGYADLAARCRAAEAGFDLHLLKPVEVGFYERIHLLAENTKRLREEIVRVSNRNPQAMASLAAAYIQTGYTTLYVARTTNTAPAARRVALPRIVVL